MRNLSLQLFRTGKGLFFRTEMDRLLASSMFFGCVMVLLRIVHTGSYTFMSMIWNLFLGYIPYVLSTWLAARNFQRPAVHTRAEQLLRFVILLVWLLFIPNSFYMLTDLFHLSDGHQNILVPKWFDLVLILSFAWNGLLMGVLSVRQMEKVFLPRGSALASWLFITPVMGLNGLGVFIGRYLRYNSWDIVVSPIDLLSDITGMIIHPFRFHYAWYMIGCFSILLTLIYRMMRKGGPALA